MDDKNVINEIHHDDNCFWGYLGVILGSLLSAVLMALFYKYLNKEIFLLFSFLTPIFAFEGYKFFKATVNKNTIPIILVLSILIHIVSTYYLIPIFLERISNGFNENNYYANLKESMVIGVFSFVVGLVITFYRVNALLERYESTNEMIKDTNTFIRKDNSPIVNDKSLSGISYSEEKGIKTNEINSQQIKKDKINNIQFVSNRRIMNASTDMEFFKAMIVLIIFLMIAVIGVFMFHFFEAMNTTISSDRSITTDQPFDISDYGRYNEYYFSTYYFSNGISVDFPASAKMLESSDDYLYIQTEENSKMLYYIFDKNNRELETFHKSIAEEEFNYSRDFINAFYKTINGRNVEYSFLTGDLNRLNIIYTVELNNNYLVILDFGRNFLDYELYEKIIFNIKE